jgi:hypothetical protein
MITGARAQTVIYDENAEVRQVGTFNSIEVSGTVVLYLMQGNETAVAVSAGEEKYNQKIKTEVKDGKLKISVDGSLWNSFGLADRKLKAYVSVVSLQRLEVAGASVVNISGILKTPSLQVEVNGASELKGNIETDNLSLEVAGASVVKLAGIARQGSIEANGACQVKSYDLAFETLKATSAGASNIRVTVNKELNASASGASSILYKGGGVTGTINASSGAVIKKG